MKSFEEYRVDFNKKKLNHAIKIFEKQLNGLESEDVLINWKYKERIIIMNHLNPLNENKEERHMATSVSSKIEMGDYIKLSDEFYDGDIYIVYSRVDNHKFNKQAKIRLCNQTIMCKGQKAPIPCVADNTTYGVKGLKDNGYFKEPDAKLKIIIQANEETKRYYEGMRFLIKNKSPYINNNDEYVAYKITKKDFSVLNGLYVLETELSSLSSLDDLENGIAYNDRLENDIIDEDYEIVGTDKIKVGQTEIYRLNKQRLDIVYEVDDECVQIIEQIDGECKVKALKRNGIATLTVKCGNEKLAELNIITM